MEEEGKKQREEYKGRREEKDWLVGEEMEEGRRGGGKIKERDRWTERKKEKQEMEEIGKINRYQKQV